MKFTDLGLKRPILQGLKNLEYVEATPIQSQTIPAFLSGKDVVGQSQTGTGKTAAFGLPLLNMVNPRITKIQAMVLVPTRELARQAQEEFFQLGKFARIRTLAAYGGKSIRFQKKLIDKGMHIAVCTPGRAIDLIKKGYIDTSYIKYFVLDEVDRMLDMGFIDDVEWIWNKCPNIKQRMLFSATVTKEVRDIVNKYLSKDYKFIEIEPEKIVVDKINHSFVLLQDHEKLNVLIKRLDTHKKDKIIVFTQTKRSTSWLSSTLKDKGYKVGHLSGDMEQRERIRSLKSYQSNETRVMIATDVASRGLNMKDINIVINYDVPEDPESYVHRIGRTARAGKSGRAVMFVTKSEFAAVHSIEKRSKITIPQSNKEGDIIERSIQFRGRKGSGRRKRHRGGGGRRNNHRGSSHNSHNKKSRQSHKKKRRYHRRPKRPSTKEFMADFIEHTEKPERGSYWGKK